ncbi:hypothetical protein BKA70DRAFT_769369 [Coprinopsis sp. MPI-PUGE-AT-0042]|nr:hypothetical protein BKA70DRAFT_769369 [Coprinopsis sp. MPI-PUGE-AT-0042]
MSSSTYNRTIFPDDIFDTIVELIAKDLPDVSVTTTTTRRSSSRALLRHLATVSPHLRNLCQAVIFQNITVFPTRGQPSWLADSQYVEDYPEAAWSSSITLFRNNPRLFDYARTLELVLETSDFTTRMPSHFEAVVIPFFLDNLRHLEGISVGHSPNSLFLWSCLDTRSQEAIRNCIAKNSLKSFAVSNCHLPRSFLGLLPSTMETLRINEWCHFPSPADDGLGSAAITACPTSLDFKTSMTLKDLPQSSILSQVSDEFFHRVISLAIHPNRSFSIETLKREVLDRVPPSIKHLTLKYHGPVRRSSTYP